MSSETVFGPKDNLSDAVSVPQVNEVQTAVIATAVYPAVERDHAAIVAYSEFTASVRPFEFTEFSHILHYLQSCLSRRI